MASPRKTDTSPGERRVAAVTELHAQALGAERADYDGTLHLEVAEIAARIRALAPLSRSPRWAAAAESWALMLEADADTGHAHWAYVQGSVYFGYATLGL